MKTITAGFCVEMAALEMVTSWPETATVAEGAPDPPTLTLPAVGAPKAAGKVSRIPVTKPPAALARTLKLNA